MNRSINQAMNAIAGRITMPGRAVYAGGEKGESDASLAVERLLRAVTTASLSTVQIDHLCRVLSGAMSGLWGEMLHREGIRERAWKPSNKAPGGGKRCYWQDHLSIRVGPDGVKTYVSEPYRLSGEALRELVELLEQGWKVRVEANWSTHFPGETLCVRIRRAEAPA